MKTIVGEKVRQYGVFCLLVGLAAVSHMAPLALAHSKHPSHARWQGIKQFGTDLTDRGYFSVMDKHGNLYVTGYTAGDMDGHHPGKPEDRGFDIYVRKFDPQGKSVWIRQFGSPGEDTAVAIALDPRGYIYITGQIGGDLDPNDDQPYIGGEGEGEGDDHVFLMKLDTDGDVQWLRQFGTIADDAGFGVALDSRGNPYVVGYTLGDMDGDGPGFNAGQEDIFVTAFDADGNQRWLTQFGTPAPDVAYAITIDIFDDIYITGFSEGDLDTIQPHSNEGLGDIIVAKLNKRGKVQWIRQVGTSGDDNGYAITVDNARRIYIAGYVSGDFDGNGPDTYGGERDVIVFKMKRDGDLMWSRQFATAGDDFGLGIAVDHAGNVYATGTVFGDLDGDGPQTYAGRRDAAVIKLGSNGRTKWIQELGTGLNDWGFNVLLDEQHRQLYITGQTGGDLDGDGRQTFGGVFDAFILKRGFAQPWDDD